MKSFWNGRSCLIAVALAAAGAGALAGLQPALAGGGRTGGGSIIFQSADWSTFSVIDELGDGTAVTIFGKDMGDGRYLNSFVWGSTEYSIATAVQPGQSGRGTGSGTGHFTAVADIYDINTFEWIGNADVSVDLAAAGGTDSYAYVNQGVEARTDPFSGDTMIVRQNRIGNQVAGQTAGSASFSIDGGPAAEETGFGLVASYKTNTVQRIR